MLTHNFVVDNFPLTETFKLFKNNQNILFIFIYFFRYKTKSIKLQNSKGNEKNYPLI